MFPTGYGPLRLSPSGKLGDPEVCSSVPPSSVRRIRLSVMWRTVRAMQLSPYRAGLAGRHDTRLPVPPAFPTGSCPLQLSPSGESMTQESPFELLLTLSRMQHRVPRRTVSLHPAPQRCAPCHGDPAGDDHHQLGLCPAVSRLSFFRTSLPHAWHGFERFCSLTPSGHLHLTGPTSASPGRCPRPLLLRASSSPAASGWHLLQDRGLLGSYSVPPLHGSNPEGDAVHRVW